MQIGKWNFSVADLTKPEDWRTIREYEEELRQANRDVDRIKTLIDCEKVKASRAYSSLSNACQGRSPIAGAYAKSIGFDSLEKSTKTRLEELMEDLELAIKKRDEVLNRPCPFKTDKEGKDE